jgi:predicted RNase H-like HicB family nuclease
VEIPVTVGPTPLGGFRAESPSPFTVVAEGSTREEAVAKVREELNKQLEQGQIVLIEVGSKEVNPWLRMAGTLKDNPIVDEWRGAVEEYRRQRDLEDGIEYQERP